MKSQLKSNLNEIVSRDLRSAIPMARSRKSKSRSKTPDGEQRKDSSVLLSPSKMVRRTVVRVFNKNWERTSEWRMKTYHDLSQSLLQEMHFSWSRTIATWLLITWISLWILRPPFGTFFESLTFSCN